MAETVVLKVGMSCQGCAGAVKRALGKMEGVESYDIDLKEQKVTVKGNVQPEAVLQTVSKTGKKTSFWDEPSPVPETKIESKPTAPETESKPAAPETESKPTAPETESKPAALETESKPAAPETEVKPVEGEEKATEAAVGAAS